MPGKILYRSLLLGAAGASVLLAAGCGMDNGHKTQSQTNNEMSTKWNNMRLSIDLQQAESQYAVGDYDKCLKLLNEGFAIDPKNAGLHVLAAKVDIEKSDLDSAAQHLKLAIASRGGEPEPHFLLGVIYQRWQKWDAAREEYQHAWDAKPAEVRYMLAVVEMKITLGQLDEAKQTLLEKESVFEGTAAIRIALARIASIQGDYEAACKHYRDAIILLPDDANLRLSYGEALFFAGKYADAAPVLEEVRHPREMIDEAPHHGADADEPTANNDSALLLMLGDCYLKLRRPNEARGCYQAITADHPENTQAVLGLGKVCVQTNELNLALSASRRVLESDPQNVDALLLMAAVQQKQKLWGDALDTLSRASTIAPKDSTIVCMEGVSTEQLGHKDRAIALYEKAMELNPQDSWASDLLNRLRPPVVPEAAKPELPPAPAGNASDQAKDKPLTDAQPVNAIPESVQPEVVQPKEGQAEAQPIKQGEGLQPDATEPDDGGGRR